MIKPTTWEKLMSQLSDLPDEHLEQVIDFIRSLSRERSGKAAIGRPRYKLRDILRQADPELFQLAESNYPQGA